MEGNKPAFTQLILQKHCTIFSYMTRMSASYKYAEQNNPELNPKRNRDDDGKVKT